jgi:methylglutaconyl-CoA hydratase
MGAFVNFSISDGVGTVNFFHPQSNSLPGDILRKIAAEITAAGKNPDVKVIVLKSEGEKAFCAGASFDELVSIDNLETGKIFFSGFAARVQWKAVGGGVGLASAADLAFAHESASVKLSELAVGIGPFVVGPAVERKIGKSAFSLLSISATEWKSAAWALEKGLYAGVFNTVTELDSAIEKTSGILAGSSPEAMANLKSVLWEGTENWDKLLEERAGISGRLVLSDFTRNAIAAFKAK